MKVDIQIVENRIDIEKLYGWAAADEAGSIVTFTGTVRKFTQGKEVIDLEFESYIPMAIKELQKIVEDIGNSHQLLKVAVHHRVGQLTIGEIPVYIIVTSAHRAEGFVACKYIIDTLKQTVPIWKKEIFADGEIWVAAHP